MRLRATAHTAFLSLLLLLAGCLVGPNYYRPSPAAEPAPRYKELPGWVPAAPADAAPKGDWWIDFRDPLLDRLEPSVGISNQTVLADYQNYQQALALVREADAALFPTIGATGFVTRSRSNVTVTSSGANVATAPSAVATPTAAAASRTASVPSAFEITEGAVEGTVSWDLDIWGKVRRTIEENQANAQASEATLANATLSEQVTLATTVINLRVTDIDIDLLTRTVTEYTEYLRVVSNAVKAGYSLYPPSDELIARVQLENAQASLIALGVARAQYEHAIAVLVGRNPEDLDIPRSTGLPAMPEIPVGVPSILLQRRPDIAAAERTMKAQNAAIGVAVAAYYPDISLSAAYGFAQGPLGGLFSAANTVWSIGATGTETIFDFGARRAEVAAAKAAYQSAVANYRATVLSAFQGVEDNLAGLRILSLEAEALRAAVRDAKSAAQIALNEYLAGTVDYTTVATAQATALTDEENLLTVRQNELVEAATLIGDLGGGWSEAQLNNVPYLDTPAQW
ncbi:MAG TPA: efflux transporter outer membrane subunit [Candidatus Binataceae bacterium]|nr:efflux transporter outer membrane subunit [Candidatus Binataceae bacterium]